MALNNINLDDKRWITIAEEARLLIPSFSREWTDHNSHDPGITFLELFAWLEEIQRYRLNRTSAATRERFFAIAGVRPGEAEPAKAVVHFEAPERSSQRYIFVPKGTPLSITGHLDLPYETIRDSYLLVSKVSVVMTVADGRELDRTSAQQESAGHFDAFGPDPKPGDALVITFKNPLAAPEVSLSFCVFDADLSALTAGCPPTPSVELRWEYSGDMATWQPLAVVLDTTAALTLNGFVVFQPQGGASITAIRAVVAGGNYEIPPRIATIRLNALEVRQVGLAAPELESGTGIPDQQRRLDFLPLHGESLVLQVGPAGAEDDWSLVNDLSDSEPTSKHYTFDPATREVVFGNGFNGRVPLENHRIVAKPFRYTLGARGNLNSGMNWRLSSPEAAADWVGSNSLPAKGGSDAEPPEETELRARAEFRQSLRGVTAGDLEVLARNTPGIRVARTKVLAAWSPLFTNGPSSGEVTVVVLPEARPDQEPQPPSAGFRATVSRHLQNRRLVANRLHVIGPDFIPVRVAATVTLKKHAAATDVRREIDRSMREFLSPRTWPFGRNVFPSEVHQRLAGVAGVAFASKVRINNELKALELGPIQLPRFEAMALQIREARDA